MEQYRDKLLEIREYIKIFIGKYESYVKPAGKFILAFITFKLISGSVGYASRLGNVAIILIISLLASFLPINFIPVLAAVYVLLNLYALSLESAGVVAVILLVLFLVYYRFTPKDAILTVLTPVLYVFKIPYAMPLVAGLVAPPTAMFSTGCGVIMYYILKFFKDNKEAIQAMTDGEILDRFKFVLAGILFNKEMYVAALAFAITIVVVSVVRKLDVDHAWTIAIISGTLVDILVILLGDLKLGTYISVGTLLLSSVVGVIAAYITKLFLFNLDYSRTEKVQFEDDEYYYYVKAVPKNLFDVKTGRRVVAGETDGPQKKRQRVKTEEETGRHRRYEEDDDMSGLERAAAEKARRSRTQGRNN